MTITRNCWSVVQPVASAVVLGKHPSLWNDEAQVSRRPRGDHGTSGYWLVNKMNGFRMGSEWVDDLITMANKGKWWQVMLKKGWHLVFLAGDFSAMGSRFLECLDTWSLVRHFTLENSMRNEEVVENRFSILVATLVFGLFLHLLDLTVLENWLMGTIDRYGSKTPKVYSAPCSGRSSLLPRSTSQPSNRRRRPALLGRRSSEFYELYDFFS